LQNIQIDQKLPVTTLPTVTGTLSTSNNFYYRSSEESEESFQTESTPLALGNPNGLSSTSTIPSSNSNHYSYLFNSTSYLSLLITLCILSGLMGGIFIILFIKQRRLLQKI